MANKAVIISGEAPESDDESISGITGLGFPLILASNSCGTMIQGEAKESDDETNSVSSSNYVMNPTTCSAEIKSRKSEKSYVKYNSLLHKKLRECNKSLDKNIKELISTTISNGMEELAETNKQLVKSELVLQETVCKLQTAAIRFEDTLNNLAEILDEGYLKHVKV
ncbi:uncharacterized protein LOC106645294 [Copidosoma floridanum]|uniref:uncharacterized protein LOC106645294 n=1 Tax=Copidosoma floridanum TaxID=29053 RepID=UPI0006C9A3D7|nr:uncharacterized protein LOC106645294 [Copidosoma floridanum]